ncbi:unnamed protein product [Cuscuta epithymum]|uniref:Uncharacterized protein n=1 Tax=Cuscuta epithymum TaxID=186058 RepID=A0AAV0GJX4_9ASTE|nr:unnamed protein product [Cuscuta epithymum]
MAALQAPPPSLVHGKRGGGGARRAPTRSWLSPPYLLLSSSSPHMTSYVAKAPKIISMRVAAASKQAYICRDCGCAATFTMPMPRLLFRNCLIPSSALYVVLQREDLEHMNRQWPKTLMTPPSGRPGKNN